MSAVADFEHRLLDAIRAPVAGDAFDRQPGLAVYRNTWRNAAIDALAANHPAVLRLVGADWFRSAAARFVEAHPPVHASLYRYGERFPAFVAGLASTADLPYLLDVARLDRWWIECHVAADATPLEAAELAAELAACAPDALASRVLVPLPAARWGWFEALPIRSIWQAGRDPDPAAAERDLAALRWHGEGVLLVRPGLDVQVHPLSRAGVAFLDACAAGRCLAEAVEAAHAAADVHAVNPTAEPVDTVFADLLAARVFTARPEELPR